MPPTILVVDDDRNFCEILAKAFSAEGYNVCTAFDGDGALRAVEERQPDLMTLDLLLPKRDGFSVLEAVRAMEHGSGTPVMLLSGCTPTQGYRDRAASLGAAALLTKPVPLERLLTLASKEIGNGEHALATTRPRSTRRRRSQPRLSGKFEDVSVPALLHHLHGLRASGVLHLHSGKKRKKLELRNGHPVAIKSNLVDECLGNLLVATGKITWGAMHESLRRVKCGEGMQGQILVAMHMLDEQDLATALRNQAEEKLFELFSWEKGSFEFQKGVRLTRSNTLALNRSPANAILDGVRARFSIEAVDRFFSENAHLKVMPSESPFYRFQEIELDPRDQLLFREIDGSKTLSEMMPIDEVSRRTLFGWIAIELLELRRSEGAAPQKKRKKPKAKTRPKQARAGRIVGAPPERPQAPSEEAMPELVPLAVPVVPLAELREEGVRSELAAMAERLRGCDFFQVLGVPQRTTDDEVREAYMELAKRTHPDRFNSSGIAVKKLAEEIFGLVSRAHEKLCDREKRLEYLRAQRDQVENAAALEEGQRALRAELEFQKGEGLMKRKEYEEATRCFQRAVHTYPEEGEYHAHLGWAFYLADPDAPGRLGEAREHVLTGRKLAPDGEKPYLFLGRLYKAAGRHALAERMFGRAVELNPDCLEAIRELRLINMRREKPKGLVRRILRR